jgi:hypothetical protein
MFHSHVQVGQQFYVKLVGNAARTKPDGGFYATVSKVGKKHFSLSTEEQTFIERIKFRVEDLAEESNYSANYELFDSLEDYVLSKLKPVLLKNVQGLCGYLSYKQLEELKLYLEDNYIKNDI